MTTPRLSPELMREALEAVEKHGGIQAAADALGLPRQTLQHRYHKGIKAGLDARIVQPAPSGHTIKGVSTLYDAGGNISAQWVKTRVDGPNPELLIETLRGAFDDIEPPTISVTPPDHADTDLLNLFALPDLHLGLYAWKEETEANWDLSTAQRTIEDTMDRVVAGTRQGGTAVILGGGDQFHSDTQDNRTVNSGHSLDVDGRFSKVLLSSCHLFVRLVTLALSKHETVVVRILPGNHDPHTSFALAYFLLAWFRLEPRVHVDASPSMFWWYRHGLVLLGATHGHMAKPAQMPGIMAERRAEDWGATKFRYCHTFHVHHASKLLTEGGGVITETHQTPVPKDAWHYSMGFLSGRSLQSITYHKQFGEIGRNKVAIL